MRRRLLGVIGIISFCLALIVSFLLITVLFLYLISDKSSELKVKRGYKYQYRQLNNKENGNGTVSGFVTLNDKLEMSYLSHEDENGNYNLISELGMSEYYCTGSCYCEDSYNERKSTGILVKRTIGYLVAAVSSIIAYGEAKEYFNEKCKEKMKESCSVSSLRSELQDCYKVEEVRGSNLRRMKYERKFYCKGQCMKKDNSKKAAEVKGKDNSAMSLSKRFVCSDLKLRSEIIVDEREMRNEKMKDLDKFGKTVFMKEYLRPFCRGESLYNFLVTLDNGEVKWEEVFMCQAGTLENDSPNPKDWNFSVMCTREYDPENPPHEDDDIENLEEYEAPEWKDMSW